MRPQTSRVTVALRLAELRNSVIVSNRLRERSGLEPS